MGDERRCISCNGNLSAFNQTNVHEDKGNCVVNLHRELSSLRAELLAANERIADLGIERDNARHKLANAEIQIASVYALFPYVLAVPSLPEFVSKAVESALTQAQEQIEKASSELPATWFAGQPLSERVKELYSHYQSEAQRLRKMAAEAQERAEKAEGEKKRIQRESHNCYYDCVSKVEANERIATEQDRMMELICKPKIAELEATVAATREQAIEFAKGLVATEWQADDDGGFIYVQFATDPQSVKDAAQFLHDAGLLERHAGNSGWFRWVEKVEVGK